MHVSTKALFLSDFLRAMMHWVEGDKRTILTLFKAGSPSKPKPPSLFSFVRTEWLGLELLDGSLKLCEGGHCMTEGLGQLLRTAVLF
jgi:hypothetical protein